jgi:hypothetical protein|tara:strand:- start:1537 stop:1725 length:189 start_codon:yes stop_codon:yes gene_type:complete
MIAYCPLEELEPPSRTQKSIAEPEEIKEDMPQIGLEETEMNYVIMAFIAGVIILAVSDATRA